MVNNFTNCMTSTSTGVPAEGVDAGGRVATLVVPFTSGHDRGKSFTFGLVVCHVPVRTFADHGPETKKLEFKAEIHQSLLPQFLPQGECFIEKVPVKDKNSK